MKRKTVEKHRFLYNLFHTLFEPRLLHSLIGDCEQRQTFLPEIILLSLQTSHKRSERSEQSNVGDAANETLFFN